MRLPPFPSTALLLFVLLPLGHAQQSDVAALPPGISLPRTGTAYAIHSPSTGPALVQLHPSEIVSNSHAAGNFARSMVYAGAHASVELKNASANTSLTGPALVFLVRINGDDPELMRTRVHLIHLEQNHDRRVVSTYTQNVFGGGRAKHYDDIALVKQDAEPDVWLRITPETPLEPGEYGIVFMPKDTNLAPDAVYDFTVTSGGAPVPVSKEKK